MSIEIIEAVEIFPYLHRAFYILVNGSTLQFGKNLRGKLIAGM